MLDTTADWRGMEIVLARMASLTPPCERLPGLTARHMDLAVAAATASAKPQAPDYFLRWANQDRRMAPGFYPLPSRGLLEQIRAYYHRIAAEEPRSETPRRLHREVGI